MAQEPVQPKVLLTDYAYHSFGYTDDLWSVAGFLGRKNEESDTKFAVEQMFGVFNDWVKSEWSSIIICPRMYIQMKQKLTGSQRLVRHSFIVAYPNHAIEEKHQILLRKRELRWRQWDGVFGDQNRKVLLIATNQVDLNDAQVFLQAFVDTKDTHTPPTTLPLKTRVVTVGTGIIVQFDTKVLIDAICTHGKERALDLFSISVILSDIGPYNDL